MNADLELRIVFRSLNGEDGWLPIDKDDVPEWVIDSMDRLLEGECAQKDGEGAWFTAIRASDLKALMKVGHKIERRIARRLQVANTVH